MIAQVIACPIFIYADCALECYGRNATKLNVIADALGILVT